MSASTDVESQSPATRSRSRCLDTFLVGSVIALFLMFGVAIAGALFFANHIERKMNARSSGESQESRSLASILDQTSSYKMQSFAYLEATNSQLETGVMPWKPVNYGEIQTVGSLYSFNQVQQALTVKEQGSYFLYVTLTFSCTHVCEPAQFDVIFPKESSHAVKPGEQHAWLTCSVQLSQDEGRENATVSKTCWNVITFTENENRLLAKAKTDFKHKQHNWKLELNHSGFGIFLIDGVKGALPS
ncbi:uncharacterized protein LOC130228823 [Danio aesculapii]|uniref:uncharacterized protein LOC130228823 n=1 Tax=Danio aesculapii TaxID=1142201 RepID=UPI0024BFEF3F|nr:uncharacterized protein LOC130228823 [Danio aesculapii]